MLLIAHILAIGFVLGVITLADKDALDWVRGKTPLMDRKRLHQYHNMIWSGLVALTLTGIFLLLPNWEYLLSEPLFLMKMLFVVILIVNGVLIGRLQVISSQRMFASLSWAETIPLMLSGAISFGSWAAAFALAIIIFE
jgi:hypothetical protein